MKKLASWQKNAEKAAKKEAKKTGDAKNWKSYMAPIPEELQGAEDTDSMYTNFPADHPGGYTDANGEWIADGGGYEDDYGQFIWNPEDTDEGYFDGLGEEAVWIPTPTKAAPEYYLKSRRNSSPPPNESVPPPPPGPPPPPTAKPSGSRGDLMSEISGGASLSHVDTTVHSDGSSRDMLLVALNSSKAAARLKHTSTVDKSGPMLQDLPAGLGPPPGDDGPPPGPPPPPMAKPSGTRGDLMSEISGGSSPAPDEVLVATRDFTEEQPGDLGLRSGDRVIVTSKADGDWWDGYLESDPSKSGQFPSSHVHPLPGGVGPPPGDVGPPADPETHGLLVSDPPAGMSKVQQLAWKRKQKKLLEGGPPAGLDPPASDDGGGPPAGLNQPPPPKAQAPATQSGDVVAEPPPGLSKVQQIAWKRKVRLQMQAVSASSAPQ